MMKSPKTKLSVLVFVFITVLCVISAGICAATCPENITGYWKLDKPVGGGGYKDEIKGYTGTGLGDLDSSTGIVNRAAVFNGDNTGIRIPARSIHGWYGVESFSIEFWVKTAAPISPSDSLVFVGRDDDSTGMQWWVGAQDITGNASFYLQDGSGAVADLVGVGKSLTDGEWHHVVAIRNGETNDNTLFVDGVVQGSSANTAFPLGFSSKSATLDIGYLNRAPFYRFSGMIDEVALYNRALSQNEIMGHVDAGNNGIDYCEGALPTDSPYPDDTVSVWHLDETGGDTYVDAFGQNDGSGDNSPTAALNGRVEGAQRFDGVETGIVVDPSSTFGWYGVESFSIEFWAKTAASISPSDSLVIVGRNDDSTGMQWWVGAQDITGNASFYLQDGSGNVANLVGVGKSITDGEWHHVMAVRDGSDNKNTLYVDGAVQGSSVTTAFPRGFGSQSSTLDIGYLNREPFYRFGGGLIDEVAIYNRALPQSEIITHVEAGTNGKGVQSLKPEPTVDAGSDQTATANTKVDLTGSATPGYAGSEIQTYLWEQTAGSTVADLTNADSANANFTAPDIDTEETLTFMLTVKADDGQSNSDTVDVTVSKSDPPIPPPPSGGDDDSSGCFVSSLF